MLMTLEEAKASIAYYKDAHPNHYIELGGDLITDALIKEAVAITDAVCSGSPQTSEDTIFKAELTRLCNEPPRG